MVSKELQVALRLLAKTSEFQAEITRASGSVAALGTHSEVASNKAKQGFTGAQGAAGGLASQLKTVALGFLSMQTALQAVKFADAFNGANDGLALAVHGSVDLANAQDLIFEAAQRSGGELVGSTKLAGTFFKSFEAGGVLAEEALTRSSDLVRIVNEGLALGGGAAEANQAALTQLVQGIQSGTFAGDELKSVLEQSPALAEALAKGMGKSVGELKALGAAGKISGTEVINALEKSASDIDAKFETIGGNAGRGLQRGLNSVQLELGTLFRDTGLDSAIELALSGAGAGIAQFIGEGRALFTDFIDSLKILFGDDLIFSGLGESAKNVFGTLSQGLFGIVNGARDAFSLFIAAGDIAIITVGDYLSGFIESSYVAFKKLELFFLKLWDSIVITATDGYNQLTTLGGLFGDAVAAPTASPRFAQIEAEIKSYQGLAAVRAADAITQKDLAAAEIQYTLEHGYTVEQRNKADVKRSTLHTELTAKSIAETKAQAAAEKKAENERIKAILEASNIQFKAVNEAIQGGVDLLNIAQSLADEVGGPSAKANQEYTRTINEIDAAYKAILANAPATQEQIKADTQARIDAKTRLDKILTDNDPILQAAKTASENWARYWGDAINDVVDNFSHFLVNGLDSFKDFGKELLNIAKEIVADLISTFLKSKITVPIQAAISGGGGISGAFSALLGSGGTAATATTAASGGSGLLGGLSAIPVAGWIAAAIAVNAQLYASGWRPQGGTVEFGNGGTFTGGGAVRGGGIAGELILPGLGIANVISITTDRLLRSLGLNNQVASILSGSALVTRLFGRKAPEIRSTGIDLNVGSNAASGGIFANIHEQGGLFRSSRDSVGRTGLTPEIQAQADALSAQTRAIVRGALGGLTTELESSITGSFHRLTDQAGKVIEESITVLGIKYNEGLEQLPVRVGAEDIFASLAQITGQSLETFASQFRAGAEGLLDAASTAAAAQQLIAQGAGLLRTGDLLTTVNLINDLQVEGEKLTDALTRVYGSAELLSQATRIMGISIAQTESDIVRFAVNIADSAGGLDQAAGLFERFFAVAFTDAERGLAQLTAAETRRTALLTQAGLSGDTTLATLRTAIEDLLKTGADPARLVLLLNAADAIADVADVVALLGDASTHSSVSIAALKDAISDLDKFTNDLNARFIELSRSGLTDFERQILSINDQLLVDVSALQRTRAEMVKRGATTEQLARIDRELARAHSFAAQAAAQAIALLRRQGQSLVAQLRKNVADNLQELADASSGAFQQITEAANDTYAAQLAGLKSIKEYLDSQLLGDLSSLTPEQRLAEAQAQFNAAVAGAQTGDPAALARLTQLADILLREGRAFSPSSFPELERSIREALSGLVNAGPIGNPTASNPGGFGSDGVSNAIDNSANEFGASQAELALQIAEVMRQLGEATHDTLAEVAAEIGVSIGELVTALGISLTELTGASTTQLAALAGSLGVELTELASNVGVELGNLADRQSLLNDAVEAEIAALPESQRAELEALFDAVQDAANDPAGLVVAERNLSDAIKDIGGDTQNLLAPYFEDIDPTNPLLDINTTLNLGFADLIDAVNNINFRTGQPVPPEGSFAVGSAFIPRDMIAQIHQGEAVIDAGTMQALRRYGIPVTGGVAANNDASGNQDLLAEMRAMRTELAQLRATVAAGDADNVKATARAAKVQADAIESTRAARTGRLVGSY